MTKKNPFTMGEAAPPKEKAATNAVEQEQAGEQRFEKPKVVRIRRIVAAGGHKG